MSFVYLIAPEAVLHRDHGKVVKIGFTTGAPEVRLAALQCGSPITLALVAYTEGGAGMERALHQHFAEWRSHGEWFFLDGPVRMLVEAFGDHTSGRKFYSRPLFARALIDAVGDLSGPLAAQFKDCAI